MKEIVYGLAFAFFIMVVVPVAALAQEVNIKLTMPELQIVGKALEKMPYAEVAPLFTKLQQQIAQQQAPPPIVPEKPVEKKE